MKDCVSLYNCRTGRLTSLIVLVAALLVCALPAAAGASWTAQSLPGGGSIASGVSCTSGSVCTATGGFTRFADRMKESTWEAMSTPPLPEESVSEGNGLWGVFCTSATACTSVGQFMNKSSKVLALADHWNGTSWSLEKTVVPSGAQESYLHNVSCVSSIKCIAAGRFKNSEGHTLALTESQKGTVWGTPNLYLPGLENNSELFGVSCIPSEPCTVVGKVGTGASEVPLIYRAHEFGTVWIGQEPALPKEAKGTRLTSVSCVSETMCMAVGFFNKILIKNEEALAELWNGTSWTAQEPAHPVEGRDVQLASVSCTSTTECMAVGHFTNNSGKVLPLAEKWNGTSWTAEAPYVLAPASEASLEGVSCVSTLQCQAVGQGTNGEPMVEVN